MTPEEVKLRWAATHVKAGLGALTPEDEEVAQHVDMSAVVALWDAGEANDVWMAELEKARERYRSLKPRGAFEPTAVAPPPDPSDDRADNGGAEAPAGPAGGGRPGSGPAEDGGTDGHAERPGGSPTAAPVAEGPRQEEPTPEPEAQGQGDGPEAVVQAPEPDEGPRAGPEQDTGGSPRQSPRHAPGEALEEQVCVGRGGTSEAVRQAVGGGCRSGWGRLLSVTNGIEAGLCRQGDRGWVLAGRRGGGMPPPPPFSCIPVQEPASEDVDVPETDAAVVGQAPAAAEEMPAAEGPQTQPQHGDAPREATPKKVTGPASAASPGPPRNVDPRTGLRLVAAKPDWKGAMIDAKFPDDPLLHYVGACAKLSARRHYDPRILCVTDYLIVLLHANRGKVSRCVPVGDVASAFTGPDEVVGFHCPKEYDLVVKCPGHVGALQNVVQTLYKAKRGRDLPWGAVDALYLQKSVSLAKPKRWACALQPLHTLRDLQFRLEAVGAASPYPDQPFLAVDPRTGLPLVDVPPAHRGTFDKTPFTGDKVLRFFFFFWQHESHARCHAHVAERVRPMHKWTLTFQVRVGTSAEMVQIIQREHHTRDRPPGHCLRRGGICLFKSWTLPRLRGSGC